MDAQKPTSMSTSSEMWAALLAGARLRRARRQGTPNEPHLVDDDPIAGPLVRAYVLPEDERTRRLASGTRRAW